jgi:endonuclease YncB( thermonuclease family)
LFPTALALLASAPAAGLRAETITATVLSIGDGDTLRVRQGGRSMTVRLACIDAPEMAQSPHGARAREVLQLRLRPGRTVRLDVKTTDRYGRTVAEVFSDINVGLALVEDGQAFVYRRYMGQCDAREYLAAEFRASRRRHGVWDVPGGITRPWDFRRGRMVSGSAPRSDGSSPDGRRFRCRPIGSWPRAQQLLRQGHNYLDGDGDGEACESLRR